MSIWRRSRYPMGEPRTLAHRKYSQIERSESFEPPCPSAVRDVNKNITSHFTRGQHRQSLFFRYLPCYPVNNPSNNFKWTPT